RWNWCWRWLRNVTLLSFLLLALPITKWAKPVLTFNDDVPILGKYGNLVCTC
ncbi:hypothetical protein PIB30_080418, partial [Stylosanthes scabra]|nr:hypothetical protein [Stylosanthes scabra]